MTKGLLPSELIRDFSDIKKIRLLGTGAFGSVYLIEDPSSGQLLALKEFNQPPHSDRDTSEIFFREVEALVRLAHPCILSIAAFSLKTGSSPPAIATKFALNGSLREALDKKRPPPFLDDTGIAIIVAGIVLGMNFVHSNGIVHRDLKPANILIDKNGRPQIGDLGSSRFSNIGLTLTTQVGTPLYMAPEMYEDGDYSTAVDVYSFALILFELLTKRPVFPSTLNAAKLMKKVLGGERPDIPLKIPPIIRKIIKRGWAVDPELRDDFSDILYFLKRIEFKLTPAVDSRKVAEFVSNIESGKSFPPSQAQPLNGIIAYLARNCGGNVHEKGIVVVTCSRPADDPSYGVRNLVDVNSLAVFGTDYRYDFEDIPETPNNWVCYDFKEKTIIPSHYAIRSEDDFLPGHPGTQGPHLKSWLIQGSRDGKGWVEIDRRENNSELNARNVVKTFEVAKQQRCRFFKLVNVGRNHYGHDGLLLCALEVFGTLFE